MTAIVNHPLACTHDLNGLITPLKRRKRNPQIARSKALCSSLQGLHRRADTATDRKCSDEESNRIHKSKRQAKTDHPPQPVGRLMARLIASQLKLNEQAFQGFD